MGRGSVVEVGVFGPDSRTLVAVNGVGGTEPEVTLVGDLETSSVFSAFSLALSAAMRSAFCCLSILSTIWVI